MKANSSCNVQSTRPIRSSPVVVVLASAAIVLFSLAFGTTSNAAEPCAGPDDPPCAADEFCKLPVDALCSSQQPGVCTTIPVECPDVDEPVCGCDRVTYANPCEADAAGISVWWIGRCPEPCGGFAGLGCERPGETCVNRFDGCCCDLPGYCEPVPETCPDVCTPVCGCDGQTYDSRCDATRSGRNVGREGECDLDVIRSLRFHVTQRMQWASSSDATGYNVYLKVRDGDIEDLGDCHQAGIETPYTWLEDDPAPGTVWLLQVTGEYSGGEGAMGLGEGCQPRLAANACGL